MGHKVQAVEQPGAEHSHRWAHPEFGPCGVALYSCDCPGCEAKVYRATSTSPDYRKKAATLNLKNGYFCEDAYLIDREEEPGDEDLLKPKEEKTVEIKEKVAVMDHWAGKKIEGGETGDTPREKFVTTAPPPLDYPSKQPETVRVTGRINGKDEKLVLNMETLLASLGPAPLKPKVDGDKVLAMKLIGDYYKDNKEAILADYRQFGRKLVQKRWDIPDISMDQLEKRWGLNNKADKIKWSLGKPPDPAQLERTKTWGKDQWNEFMVELVAKFTPAKKKFLLRAAKFYGIDAKTLKARYLNWLRQKKVDRGEIPRHTGGRVAAAVTAPDGLPPVPPKPENKSPQVLKKYYHKYRRQIIVDIAQYGHGFARKRWGISSSGFSRLCLHWKVPKRIKINTTLPVMPEETDLHQVQPAPSNGRPVFPSFNDKWDKEVQLKWLEVYPQVQGVK